MQMTLKWRQFLNRRKHFRLEKKTDEDIKSFIVIKLYRSKELLINFLRFYSFLDLFNQELFVSDIKTRTRTLS